MTRVLENTVLVNLIRDNNKKEVFSMKGLVGFKEIEKYYVGRPHPEATSIKTTPSAKRGTKHGLRVSVVACICVYSLV